LIASEQSVVMPGVFNAITAKLAARAGFAALYLSGAGVTNALTGYPDVGLLTLTEMALQARYVTAATDLPVIADADTGYGEALNTARTVQEFEHAGLAGIHLEDQLSPKRCGHLDGKRVISATDMANKIRAASNARYDPDFLLIARTDSRSEHGLQDAIERAKRYLDAGADAIFPESLQSIGEFEKFSAALGNAPLMANMTEFGKTPLITAAEFATMGYSMVIFPMSAFRVMMKAGEQAYAELIASGTQAALLDKMQTRAELYDLIEYDRFDRMDKAAADTSL
jgi:methylisocitrate lyase